MSYALSTTNFNLTSIDNLISLFKEKEDVVYDMLTQEINLCMKV